MLHQPAAQLFRHDGLAGHGHLLRPASIDPNPKLPQLRRERKIDQFDFKAGSGFLVPNRHNIMRFGPRHAPFYCVIFLSTSIMLQFIVHAKIPSRAYRARSISR